jgi:putative RNA 2'-phosphotransferase
LPLLDWRIERASKFLSLILRHQPEVVGVTLDAHGWVAVDELVAKSQASAQPLSRDLIEELVRTSDKRRFELSDDGLRIRANQGHSVAVDLALAAREPPERLFHGTASRYVAAIRAEGLKPRSRQQVHLSADRETAVTVGARHGKPVVLTIAALAMHREGHVFTRSDNGVWLVGQVPAGFIDW